MTYAEYLAAEETAAEKHEYLRGEVWAMAGGTIEHARLAMSFGGELRNALAEARRPCVVLSSDARVRIRATDRATYPDLSVVCGGIERASDDPHGIVNPTVIVEVLSDSTSAEDRGEKFAHYRRLLSLREYVLVSQKEQRLEVYHREGDFWRLAEARSGQSLRLESLGVAISVDAVYADPLGAAPPG